MPPTISPTTRDWPRLPATEPQARVTSITTGIWKRSDIRHLSGGFLGRALDNPYIKIQDQEWI